MNEPPITESSGNVFSDLGFSEEEATLLKLRADLMASLREVIDAREWTQAQAAQSLGISQPRVSDLIRGKWDRFSLDMLLALAVRVGLHPHIELKAA
ncbi:XRE family transcriptional regulator [Caballeronia megalochromosomata]|nr:XRE family transcriptional regulator [Caballeronia megalochromosomata]